MKFGVCGDMALAAEAAKARFDYAEATVENLLKPFEPEAVFADNISAFKDAPLPRRMA